MFRSAGVYYTVDLSEVARRKHRDHSYGVRVAEILGNWSALLGDLPATLFVWLLSIAIIFRLRRRERA